MLFRQPPILSKAFEIPAEKLAQTKYTTYADIIDAHPEVLTLDQAGWHMLPLRLDPHPPLGQLVDTAATRPMVPLARWTRGMFDRSASGPAPNPATARVCVCTRICM